MMIYLHQIVANGYLLVTFLGLPARLGANGLLIF
jgi:hypothetical protein